MPVPTIFLIDKNGEMVEMCDQPYDSEGLLQTLLARYPSVLAGDQMNDSGRVKWLFVAREAGIPGEDGGGERYSLDHIFIDQNAVPTLVEVKRSTDTRIRREVVGQMLDYAANAVLYWPVNTIRERFEETCREQGWEPDMVVSEFIGVMSSDKREGEIARLWEAVETNLRAGKIRLVFAADQIPPELRRVVEFLNEQMNPAEVIAVEIRQYVGGSGVRTLVPNVIRSSKRGASLPNVPSIQWDRQRFMSALLERKGPEAVVVATKILDWTPSHCPTLWWGEGRKDGSCFMGLSQEGVNYYPFAIWTYGRIQFQFQVLRQRGVSMDLIKGLASRLNEIPGVHLPDDVLNKYPSFEVAFLRDPEQLTRFLSAIEQFVAAIRQSGKPAVSTPST